MSKLTLEDVKMVGEGPQIRKAIEQRYGTVEKFYEAHSDITKKYNTLINYLGRQVIISDTFRSKITLILNTDYTSLYEEPQKQIKRHVQRIYDNISKYDHEDDQQTFDYLLELCKKEDMTTEAAMLYRARARNSFNINKINFCVEFYEFALGLLQNYDMNRKVFFLSELADDLVRENLMDRAEPKYKYAGDLVRLHKKKLDNNTLFFYYYWKGIYYMHKEKFEDARDLFILAKDCGDKNYQKSGAIANIGLTYKHQKQYTNALEYYQDALNFTDDSRILVKASIYNNIAEVYKCKKQYQTGLANVEKALEISEKENDLGKHLMVISTQAEIEMKMGDMEAYMKFLNLLLSTKGKIVYSKPDILHGINNFIKCMDYIPCLEKLHDVIMELIDASTNYGYNKGLAECAGYTSMKIKRLSRGLYNEKAE